MKLKTITSLAAPVLALALGTAPVQAALLLYEPFADLDPTLNGNTAGTGFANNWSGQAFVSPGSLSYGSLATSGGRATTNPGNQFDKGINSPGSTLTGAGLMADGTTLWFSALIVNYPKNLAAASPSNDFRTYVAFGTGEADGFDRVGGTLGSGFTVALSKVSPLGVTAQAWNDGSDGAGGATRGATVIADAATILAVGKITWGAFGVANDVFELYLPGTDLALPGAPISTIEADFDQLGTVVAANAFDTISFAGGRPQNLVPEVDEIRFGATYADVTPVIPEPASLSLLALAAGLGLIRRRR